MTTIGRQPRDVPSALLELQPDADSSWFETVPTGAHAMRRRVVLPGVADLERARRALFGWELHRRAGLGVVADGDVRQGATVVLGVGTPRLQLLAPCRVVEVVDEASKVGFSYATLPGHPEQGIESFVYSLEDGRGVFELRGVSRHRFWGSRLVPVAARRVQDLFTDRYLRAAAEIALPERH